MATIATGSARADQAVEAFDEKEREKDNLAGSQLGSQTSSRDGTLQPDDKLGKGSDTPVEDIELAGLTEEQRKIVVAQVHVNKPKKPVNYFKLWRYATRTEIVLNLIGLIAAIAAGAAQPLMTIAFSGLTTSFTRWGSEVIALQNGTGTLESFNAARDRLYSDTNQNVLYLVYIGIASFAATYIFMAAFQHTGETNTRRVREAYLAAVLRQNLAYFDAVGAGEVTTRIENDTHLLQEGISEKVPISVMHVAMFFAGFAVAFAQNWRLTIVLISIVPWIAASGGVMEYFTARLKHAGLESGAQGATLCEETFASVRNAHAFGTQAKLTSLYDVYNAAVLKVGLKSAWVQGGGLGSFFFVVYASYGLAFYYGTTLILKGQATSGEIVGVFFSVLIGAFALAELAPKVQSITFAIAAGTSLFNTIDRVPIIDSASDAGLKPDSVSGVIEVKDVDFFYPSRPSVQVLYKFTGVFPRGKTTALVGGSGSGKSTIVSLVERFYDPVGGSITLDGIELKDLNVNWLRTQIGLVSQEPTLFATTAAGNIEHGLIGTRFEHEAPEQKRARVIAAAKEANADGFISALPNGYDTMIGESGRLLSGGQKQRIAIARAIVGDPPILLLDEATSALDTNSEVIVQDALDKASAGRTTITIAHRLSTIRQADQIIVLTAGHILESAMTNEHGSAHDQLLSRPEGAYLRLVNAQRIREEVEEQLEDGDENTKPETRQDIEALARQEKPQFDQLKRTGTGRSAASEALRARGGDDVEAQRTKRMSLPYVIKRMTTLVPYWSQWSMVIVTSCLVGAVYPVFGIIFGGIQGVFSLDPDTEGSRLRSEGNRYALYCFIVSLVATLGVVLQAYFSTRMSEILSRTMRLKTFASTLRQDISYFDRDENSTGHLTARVSNLAQQTSSLFGITGAVIVQNVFTIIAGSAVGLAYSWKIALIGIACVPLNLAAGIARLRVVELKDAKNKESHSESAQLACEAAAAIRTVASLTREKDCCQLYSDRLEEPMRRSNKSAVIGSGLYALSQAISFFIIGLVFWVGSRELGAGRVSPQDFFVSLISVTFASIETGMIFAYVPDMSKARSSAADFIKLIDAEPEIDADDQSGTVIERSSGHLRFRDIRFRYPTRPHVPVLRGLNIEVHPGQYVAVVGASGSGKSTLIQLTERFYDPLVGTVELDGQDVSKLNLRSFRNQISLVSQEPTLYAGTVRFNITLGALIPAEQVTQEDLERVCRDANILDFINSLPDGFETQVGGKGTQLSGGQKQRIAIARALIRDPRVLLLDEATSALDSESEKVVQKALDQAAKGRTTIAVAHRLSTIQNADCIYVIAEGKVAESGTHSELMARKGLYMELVAQQSLEKTQ